jgi:putative endonuclease
MVSREAFVAVYKMSNRKHGTLHIGVTADLITRIAQHRSGGGISGFTQRHGLKRLVWFESWESISEAIHREKALKTYPRAWKINLIERDNPNWGDLYLGFF